MATLRIYEQHRFFTLDLGNPLVWLGVFLIRDFVYYRVHRAEHTFNVLWASHLVHHFPETIGMATAVRVPWMEAIYKPFFSLWLPLIGFNPLAAIGMDVFAATLSQLQHTERFPRDRPASSARSSSRRPPIGCTTATTRSTWTRTSAPCCSSGIACSAPTSRRWLR